MQRDMDLVRRIILAVQQSDDPVSGIEGVSEDIFAHHAQLLDEAGLIKAALAGSDKQPAKAAIIYRLTWAGQDFADAIADDTLWNKAKDVVIKPAASWTFGVLLDYLRVQIASRIPGLAD